MHAQTNKKLLLHKKSSDPQNLPMTPKFSNKGSSMTPKNGGLAESLMVMSGRSVHLTTLFPGQA